MSYQTDRKQTNAMRVTNYSWGPALQNEANKMWFYAISFSILLSLYNLAILVISTPSNQGKQSTISKVDQNEKSSKAEVLKVDRSNAFIKLVVHLAIDCCDLLIPGSSIGWILVPEAAVGAAQATSSALATPQIWRRVQRTG